MLDGQLSIGHSVVQKIEGNKQLDSLCIVAKLEINGSWNLGREDFCRGKLYSTVLEFHGLLVARALEDTDRRGVHLAEARVIDRGQDQFDSLETESEALS